MESGIWIVNKKLLNWEIFLEMRINFLYKVWLESNKTKDINLNHKNYFEMDQF